MKHLPNEKIIEKIKCPHCGAAVELLQGGASLVCGGARRHCYDISSSGYVNLLPSGYSGSGDGKAAVRARKEFLDKGYYRPAAEALADILADKLKEGSFIVDGGCGEGYYTSLISEKGFYTAGVDISKFATDAAAKRAASKGDTRSFFATGSVYEMPFFDGSADGAVNIFAPCAEEEFCRILKDGGILAVVYAGPEHLMGLKRALYDTTKENDGRADMPKKMKLLGEKRVRFDITVNGQEDIQRLFSMTPYYWRTSLGDSEKLKHIDSLTTEVDMIIAVYEK